MPDAAGRLTRPPQRTRPLDLPVALLLGRALVVLLLTPCESDQKLRAPLVPVQLERHERIAAPLDETGQPVDLSAMKQQAPRARRIRLHLRRRAHDRRDMRAGEPRLVVAPHDISLGDLRFAGTYDIARSSPAP